MSKQTKELLRANNAQEKLLNAANTQVMTDIVVYIRSANISEYEQELARRDIFEMLYNGQQHGRSAEEIIGDDRRAFCDAVIAALPPLSARERTLKFVGEVLAAVLVLGVIWGVSSAVGAVAEGAWPYLPLTVGDVIGQALLVATAFAIFNAISKHAFDGKHGWGGLFVLVFVALALSLLASIRLTHLLCMVHVAALAAVLAVVAVLTWGLGRMVD